MVVQHAIDNTNANLCNAFKNCNLESHDYLWPLTTQDHSGGSPYYIRKKPADGIRFSPYDPSTGNHWVMANTP